MKLNRLTNLQLLSRVPALSGRRGVARHASAAKKTALQIVIFSLLACFLFAFRAEAQVREIKVTAAVSSTFKFNPNWDRDIRDRILYVNKVFEPAFGVHFSVKEFVAWEPIDETRETDLLMEELRGFIPMAKDEIVIGFHKMSEPFSKEKVIDNDTVGSAQFFRGFVVIRDPFGQVGENFKNLVLLHEFAHLFGAVHVDDPNAVMAPQVPGNPSPMLDPENQKVVRSTKDVDFTVGLDSLTDDVVDGLIQTYERMIRKNPHSDFYHQLGKFYVKRNQQARAISTWEEAVKYQYDNPYIHRELGFYYYQTARNAQAIQSLGRAIAHYILPSQKKAKANALNFLGVAYYRKGNMDQAIVSWLQALTEDPDDLIIQGNLAVAYLQTGNTEKAVSELTRLAAKKMDDITILSNLGAALLRQGEYPEAIEYLTKAMTKHQLMKTHNVAKESKDPLGELLGDVPLEGILANLGFAYLRMERYEEAIRHLSEAVKINPKVYETHLGLGEAYLRVQQYKNAEEVLGKAKRLRQDDPYLYVYLSQAYNQLEKKAEAKQAITDGLRYAQGDLSGYFHKTLAVIYAQSRRFTEAKEELRVALNQNWNDPEAHLHMGNIHLIQGEKEKAKRSFQNALRIEPKYSPAKKALESLA